MIDRISFLYQKFEGNWKKLLTNDSVSAIISTVKLMRNCVMAARQTLTLFVRVQILLPQPTKKELLSTKSSFFVYPSRRLGISLTHEVRHISSRAARRPCISSRAGVYLYTRLRLDDIQCFALMIYRNKLRMIYTPSAWLGCEFARVPCISRGFVVW